MSKERFKRKKKEISTDLWTEWLLHEEKFLREEELKEDIN
jgi:hypothetical protein